MDRTAEQVRDSFKNSLPVIDEKNLSMAIEKTVKSCSVANSPDRRSILNTAFYLIRFSGWKIWLVQGVCLLVMLRLFIGFGGAGLISIPLASIRGLCIISASIPFITIPFIYRSFEYRMNELEMSTFLSYGRQLLIKLSVIGIGDLIMLLSGLYVAIFMFKLHTISAIIYGMLPFLLLKTIILYVLSQHSLDNAFWFYGVAYVTSIVCAELFARYYPLDSLIGKTVLFCLMAILVFLMIRNLKKILNPVNDQELNRAK